MENNQLSSDSSDNHIDTEKILLGFLESQNRKIDLDQKSLELQEKQLEYSNQYALAALKAQKEDRADERQNKLNSQKNISTIVIIVFLGIIAFGCYCLWANKDDVFKELIKIIGYSVIPSIGAYYYGISKGKKDSNIDIQNDSE